MKALIGIPDPAPDGFHWTDGVEILTLKGLVCRSTGCGCDRSWSGIKSTKASTLAQVDEVELQLGAEDLADARVAAALRIAAKHPIGTLLRARYDWKTEPNPQSISVERFVAAWRIDVVIPLGGRPLRGAR